MSLGSSELIGVSCDRCSTTAGPFVETQSASFYCVRCYNERAEELATQMEDQS